MNRQDALKALLDESATTRLRAARLLLEHGQAEDVSQLQSARSTEADPWTQRTIDRAVSRLQTGQGPLSMTPTAMEGQDGVAAATAQATQRATKSVLHEVRPILQSIDRMARRDIGTGYESSGTYNAITRMGNLLDALQSLSEAASSPTQTQFNLTDEISAHVVAEGIGDRITLARTDACLVKGDPTLVGLAFVNLARNAIEASTPSGLVAVNWGRNDSDAWISIFDEGEGLPLDGLSAALKVGTTSRSEAGHFGLGLPIASQAMGSLAGDVRLQPRRTGGTVAEARWPQ